MVLHPYRLLADSIFFWLKLIDELYYFYFYINVSQVFNSRLLKII